MKSYVKPDLAYVVLGIEERFAGSCIVTGSCLENRAAGTIDTPECRAAMAALMKKYNVSAP